MKKLIKTGLFLLFIAINSTLKSQDLLIFKNGSIKKSKIDLIGFDQISYHLWENKNGPQYIVLKKEIAKIYYQSGYIDSFSPIVVVQNNQEKISENSENSTIILFYNAGSNIILGNSAMKSDYFLVNNAGVNMEWGVGIKKNVSNTRFYGLNLALGFQVYSVNQFEYYQQLRSAFGSSQIYNYYIDNILNMYNLGIEGKYGIEDSKKLHRFSIIAGIKNNVTTDFNMAIYLNNGQNIYMTGKHLNSFLLESRIQYEHRIHKKFGIQFNLGIQLFNLSSTWTVFDNNNYSKNYGSNYNVILLKGSSGIMLF